ncbi:MAG: cytochrome c-type biogenesis protein CcmH [candidate division NC10 bacterium]|nr:cytochrome c-type biogenesis protein CcmH [candidate division NC10 bacterium]
MPALLGRRWQVAGLLSLALAISGVAVGASGAGSPPSDLEERVREVASELRCVVCQNLSVADSPSDLAKEMRNLVRELLQQGKTPEEIQAYFVSRYGEYVLLSPPKRGFNLLVWGLPFLAIAAGAWGIYLVTRRWTAQREDSEQPVDPSYAARVRRELQEREGPAGS